MTNLAIRAEYAPLIALFQSTEQTRYYLNGFYVEPSATGIRIVATDGHRLGMFHDEKAICDGPAIWYLDKATLQACKANRREDSGAVRWLVIQQAGESASGPHNLAIVVTSPKEGAQEAITNAASGNPGLIRHTALIQPIDGTFPDYQRIIPEFPQESASACFNGGYLADFAKVAATMPDNGKNPTKALRVYIDNSNGPAVVLTPRPDFVGVLMPIRSDQATSYPSWVRSAPQEASKAA